MLGVVVEAVGEVADGCALEVVGVLVDGCGLVNGAAVDYP